MLNLRINSANVPYDTFDDARKASQGELSFWRETLEACVADEKYWNDFVNELWQNGGSEEAVRLYAVFKERGSRRWILMALLLLDINGELWKHIVCAYRGEIDPLIAWLRNASARFTTLAIDIENDSALRKAIVDALNGSADAFNDWIQAFRLPRNGITSLIEGELEYWQKIKATCEHRAETKVAQSSKSFVYQAEMTEMDREMSVNDGLYLDDEKVALVRPRGDGWSASPTSPLNGGRLSSERRGIMCWHGQKTDVSIEYNVFGDGLYYCRCCSSWGSK